MYLWVFYHAGEDDFEGNDGIGREKRRLLVFGGIFVV